MELPADLMLSPVEGHDDLIKFSYDFSLDAKALDSEQVVTETDEGDLIIEGYAAVFEGVDRQGENFAPGAFQRGIKSFLEGSAPLCFHHDHKLVLGKVLDLQEEEGKGLRMKARVDGAIKNHPVLGTLYHQIKNGTINGLSVGGFFKRGLTEGGPRIVETDFTEISATAVPVHTGPKFAVVAGKALASEVEEVPELGLEPDTELRESDVQLLNEYVDMLTRVFTGVREQVEKRPADSSQTDDN